MQRLTKAARKLDVSKAKYEQAKGELAGALDEYRQAVAALTAREDVAA